jgi:hypothetical protein
MDTRVTRTRADMITALLLLTTIALAPGCHLVIGIEDLPPLDASSGTVDAPTIIDAAPSTVDAEPLPRPDAMPGGINRVCVLMTTTDVPGGDDENCLDVAYVP